MKTLPRIFLFIAALAAPLALSAKITRNVEQTFTVQPGGNFKALTQGGDIKIETSDRPEVHITVKQVVRADSEAEADEILSKLTLKLEQTGNDVLAEAKYEKRGAGTWFGSWPPVTVSFVVTVPKNFNLNLNTSGGNIEFARVAGDIDAGTSGGNITLQEGTAKAKLHTSGGNIEVDSAGGPTEVSTSGGDVTLRSVTQLISA